MSNKFTLLAATATLAMIAGSAFAAAPRTSAKTSVASAKGAEPSIDLTMIGLTADQRLIRFVESRPVGARSIGFVTGLSGDTGLVGIDYRVQDGGLYGVGNAGGVYLINASTAAATKVSQLSIALSGTAFGVDFNPAADRLRVVSDTGQNLRHNLTVTPGATIADTPLSYTTGVTATGIGGAAYTNNDLNADTGTTLYDIDFTLDQVVLQSPANAGTLAATGKLGLNAVSVRGFDIYSTVRNGVTVDIEAHAALQTVGGSVGLYDITLFTGKAQEGSVFLPENAPIDIAIPLNQL